MLAIGAAQASAALMQTAWSQTAGTPPVAGATEEVIVTATKRSERLQRVPVAVQVLDAKTLSQQNVNGFNDYLKLVPSLATQTLGPNATSIYLRGVSPGDNQNHSGPLPTVGSYLDEYPTTTIGGTLDIHAYDIARIEVLPGPQGTLYGASSEAGTVRIITNKPDPHAFSAGYSVEGNSVDHGGLGDVTQGFVNVPITDKIAVRLVAFEEHDAGYIDNVPGTLSLPFNDSNPGLPAFPGFTTNNAELVKKNFNPADTVGGRLTVRFDLDDDWSITPMIMGQDLRTNGVFGFLPSAGDLNVQRFQPDTDRDRWAQAGLTVNGKIGNFDLTYAGSLFVRDVHQRIDYSDYTVAYAGYSQYFESAGGQPLPDQLQLQDDKDHFNKVSNEIRLTSPSGDRLRFIAGAFQELQTHRILQDYQIIGLSPDLSIPTRANTLWLTDQLRTDTDYAVFAEASYDILPQLTLTAGVRPYYYDNSLKGFFGFSAGTAGGGYPDGIYYSHTGEGADGANCLPGQTRAGAPCVNLNKSTTGSGETHKFNLSYKIDDLRLAYFTYSTGFRPGGVNRNGALPPYKADELTNYELGLKSQWLNRRLTINTALYDEDWSNFQFAFLGQFSLTQIQNAPAANIRGIETSAVLRATDQLTLSGNLTLQDAHVVGTLCPSDPDTGAPTSSCAPGDAIITNGNQLPFVSSIKGSVTARQVFAVVPGWDGHVQGTVSFQSRAQAGVRDADKVVLGSLPAFATLDLSSGLEHGGVALELFAKNVTDTRGEVNRFISCSICTNVYVLPTVPREVGLRLSQKF